MNGLQIIENGDGVLCVSSRVVAQALDKEHNHILRDCREKLEEGVEFGRSNYLTKQGKTVEEYLLTKNGFILLCMNYQGYNDFKRAYIAEFDRMEEKLKNNTLAIPNFNNPAEAARAWADLYEKNVQLDARNERLVDRSNKQALALQELRPKADYTDTILESYSTITITQIAKDYGMSGQELNKILKDLKVQYKQNNQWLLCAKYHGKSYTDSKTIDLDNGKSIIQTRWTQKGRLFLYDILAKDNKLPLIERD